MTLKFSRIVNRGASVAGATGKLYKVVFNEKFNASAGRGANVVIAPGQTQFQEYRQSMDGKKFID